MAPAIEARGLRKVYGSRFGGKTVEALAGIDLTVGPGEIFGLLGPNGAGKTTTVKILLGLTHATAGTATLFGLPVADPESRRRVGYLPEGHRFPGYLTARQTLSIFGRMSGVDRPALSRRIPLLLERVRLSDWADVRVKKFSKGMTQRLGLAAALVHEPRCPALGRADRRRRPGWPPRDPRPPPGRGGQGPGDPVELASCSRKSSRSAPAWPCCGRARSPPSGGSRT